MRRINSVFGLCIIALACPGAAAGQANEPPFVELIGMSDGPVNPQESITVRHIVFDPEENAVEVDDAESGRLSYELHLFPDDKLATAQDVRFFASMIANELDVTHSAGTHDFSESTSTFKRSGLFVGRPGTKAGRPRIHATVLCLRGPLLFLSCR